jgi:hypothetical protein
LQTEGKKEDSVQQQQASNLEKTLLQPGYLHKQKLQRKGFNDDGNEETAKERHQEKLT